MENNHENVSAFFNAESKRNISNPTAASCLLKSAGTSAEETSALSWEEVMAHFGWGDEAEQISRKGEPGLITSSI